MELQRLLFVEILINRVSLPHRGLCPPRYPPPAYGIISVTGGTAPCMKIAPIPISHCPTRKLKWF